MILIMLFFFVIFYDFNLFFIFIFYHLFFITFWNTLLIFSITMDFGLWTLDFGLWSLDFCLLSVVHWLPTMKYFTWTTHFSSFCILNSLFNIMVQIIFLWVLMIICLAMSNAIIIFWKWIVPVKKDEHLRKIVIFAPKEAMKTSWEETFA